MLSATNTKIFTFAADVSLKMKERCVLELYTVQILIRR